MAVHKLGGNLGLMLTETLDAAAEAATFDDLFGCGMVAVQLSGTFSLTVTFEASNDGTTWTAVPMVTPSAASESTTATATGLYLGSVAGCHKFRVRCSSYTSGSVDVIMRAVYGGGGAADAAGTLKRGGFQTTITSTPTVGTGTIYATGDVIGVKNTLASAVRSSGGTGTITTITVASKNGIADIGLALRVWFFNSDPSASTFTDNAALSIADADITKVIGFVDIAGQGAAATLGQVWVARDIGLAFTASGSSSIYMVLESRGAIAANTSTSDWQIMTTIKQD